MGNFLLKSLVTFKSVGTLIFADSLQAGPFPTLTLGLPSMAALAADVGHLYNPTSVAHIHRYGNIPAFKLPTLLNVTKSLFHLFQHSIISGLRQKLRNQKTFFIINKLCNFRDDQLGE